MNDYREFWNTIFYGSTDGFAGANDVSEYWLRVALVVAAALLLGIASLRVRGLPLALTVAGIVLWAVSVGPFLVWAAECGGCGSASSADSRRSYEAMIINQAWGGLIAIAIAAMWTGTLLARRLR